MKVRKFSIGSSDVYGSNIRTFSTYPRNSRKSHWGTSSRIHGNESDAFPQAEGGRVDSEALFNVFQGRFSPNPLTRTSASEVGRNG